jgi:PPOX class probable F420-dependent enzyme
VRELTDKLRSFLGERRYAVLATHDPDGGIHLTPIWFLFEDDRFYFASSSGSRKVKNVERSFSASVVVDAREPGRERWVSASGPVEILRDGERSRSTPASGGGTSRRKRSTARSTPRSPRRTTSRSGWRRRRGGRGPRQSWTRRSGGS